MAKNKTPAEIDNLTSSLLTLPANSFDINGLKCAAVLIILFYRNDELSTVFLKRPETMPTHKGEISLPGGSIEEKETEEEAALRESKEELGVNPEKIQVVGKMPRLRTVTNFLIYPIIGYLPHEPVFMPNLDEVTEVIVAPVKFFAEAKNRTSKPANIFPERKELYFYDYHGKMIWGATAEIMKTLAGLLYK